MGVVVKLQATKIGRWLNAPVIATVAAVAISLVFALGNERPKMGALSNTGLSLLAGSAVWFSFRHHRLALGLVAVLCVASPLVSTSYAAIELITVFVLLQVMSRSDLPAVVIGVVGFTALMVNAVWLTINTHQSFKNPTVLYPVILTGLSVGLGWQVRQIRRQNAELVRLRKVDRDRAVLDERRRIARDLHDVAAHHLSVLIVHNKIARRVGTHTSLDEAANFTATTAREALESMRQVVGVLNTEGEPPREPQPSLQDLEVMFARLEEAGLSVHRKAVTLAPPRRDVELAIVRIAQEALTNVLRHRGPGNAWFELASSGGSIHLQIDDDGPNRPPLDPASRTYGVIGMKERARACGGQLDLGPSPHGGWRVTATLPGALTSA
jgi:signal transduction histidine kinase